MQKISVLVLALFTSALVFGTAAAWPGADAQPGVEEAHTAVEVGPGVYQFVTTASPPGPPSLRGDKFNPGEDIFLVLDDDWTVFIIGVDIPAGASVGVIVTKSGELTPMYENPHIATFSEAVSGFVSTGLNAGDLTPGYYNLRVRVHKEVTVDPPGPTPPITIDVPLRIYDGSPEFGVVPLLPVTAIPAALVIGLWYVKRRR